jgi:TRAP-type C4-dicarboxylate transport system permease large subunit
MTPILLIGGMSTGVFTPTEGAIAACVWALVLGLVWYRTMTLKMLAKVSMETIETTVTVMFIVAAASIFGWLLTATRVTDMVALWVLSFTHSPWVFLLLANLLMLFVADWKFRFDAVMPIMTPILLIGGMATGVFTPTEGAIAACVWALILGLVWYRTMTPRMLVKVSMDTIETTVTVMFIVAAASIFGWLLTATRVTDMVAMWVLSFTHSPWVFLLLANLLMLFVGCFLEPTAAILILVPVLLPVVQQLGIDPVHFGLVMVLNLMIGLLHPPMGMVLFVLARVANLSIEKTTMAIVPWLIPLLLSLVLITYVPQIALWLPHLLMK